MGTFDARAAWYLDTAENRVVVVRGDSVSALELTADQVDHDEMRFVEIPALTRAHDHEWMADFFLENRSTWKGPHFDDKKGAEKRFAKALAKQGADAETRWQTFHTARLHDLATDWLREEQGGHDRP